MEISMNNMNTTPCGSPCGRLLGSALICVLMVSVFCGAQAWGQVEEKQKITASDWDEEDHFGISVALSGDVALIGAPGDEVNGLNSGSVYVFRLDPASGEWVEETKLIASDGEEMDLFGISVSLSGDVALIGAEKDDDMGNDAGAAYVFLYDAGSGAWSEEAKLTASDGAMDDEFGGSVALIGDVAVIGARSDQGLGPYTGSAYVFRYDIGTGTWIEEAKLTAADGASYDYFGCSVDISGDTVVIGAKGSNDNTGSAYVFRHDTGAGSWTEEAKLTASDGNTSDKFGSAVSLDGDQALVGAPDQDLNDPDAGSAYVFNYDSGTGTWIEEAKLTASDSGPDHAFGFAVNLTEGTAVIGAYGDDHQGLYSGSAYAFSHDAVSGTWLEEYKMTHSLGEISDLFGYSIAVHGDVGLIGMPGDADGGSYSGAACVFDLGLPVQVDVKINGRDDCLIVNSTEVVTCTIEIISNDNAGDQADIWVLAVRKNVKGFSFGYRGSATWKPGWSNVYFTGALEDDSATVLDRALPKGIGTWSIHLAVDGDPDGLLDYENILAYDAGFFLVAP